LKSEETEILQLHTVIPYKDQIDKWLLSMERSMIDTLREKMNECLRIYEDKVDSSQEMERSEWIKKYNSQLVITIGQFLWTRECTRAITDKSNPRGALAD